MPSRLIREGILTSDRVNALSPEAEVFYRRLMSKVDDHGLFDARPDVLISALYPLRRGTTENTCLQMLAECIKSKLLQVYEIDGKRFLQMFDTRWKVRSEPKFPPPVNGVSVISCEQLFTTVPLDVVLDVGVVVNVGVVKDLAPPPALPPSVLEVFPDKPTTTPVTRINTPSSKGRRLDIEQLPSEWRVWALAERPDLDPVKTFDSFRDFWIARPGAAGLKLDWLATWRNWVRKERPGAGVPKGMPPAAVEYLRRSDAPTEKEIPGERVG